MTDFTINWTDEHQTIEGFGAASAFCQNFSPAVADFLWTPSGIGLTIARDKISENGFPLVLPFDGTDEVDSNFSTLAQIYARGPGILWGNIWFFHASWQGGSVRGTLDPAHYSDACGIMTTYLDRAVAAGVYMRGVSFCNEPDISGFNDQTAWTTAQAVAFTNVLGPALTSWGAANPTWQSVTGLTKPLLIMPGVAEWSNLSTWTAAVEADSSARANVDRYASHQYFGGGASAPGSISHSVWETEVYDQTNGSYTPLLTSGLVLAQNVHDALTTGAATAWIAWYAQLTATNDNQGLIGFNDSANYTSGGQSTAAADWLNLSLNLTKRAYALGNWAKFVRPNSVRLGATGSKSGIYGVTAFRNAAKSSLSIIIVNTSGSPLSVTFAISGISPNTITPYVTTDTTLSTIGTDGNLSAGSATYSVPTSIPVSAGAFTATIAPGITTLTASLNEPGIFFGAGTTS